MTLVDPLATASDLYEFGSAPELLQNQQVWTPEAIDRLMLRATRRIESICQQRLAPFVGLIESHVAEGIDPDEYGDQWGMPMDLSGALGWSKAASMGVSDMVRKFWLDVKCPGYPELWSYNIESIELLRTFGDTQMIEGEMLSTVQGPELDTGMVRMLIGTYCPIGTTIRVTYDGGYTTIPDDLNLACVFQAMKFVMLGAEPEMAEGHGMASAALDEEIATLIAPFAHY